ncbi:MAG: UPF0175 family protein [Bacteroidota bacterium]
MRQITLNIPDFVELNEKELLIRLSIKLYEEGKLSIGQAAEFAGFSKRAFIELMGNYGGSVFNYPASDLKRDVANA